MFCLLSHLADEVLNLAVNAEGGVDETMYCTLLMTSTENYLILLIMIARKLFTLLVMM